MAIHPEQLAHKVRTDRRVMEVRAAITRTEHEIRGAKAALGELPTWALEDLMVRGEEKLRRLRESEAAAVAQAQRVAEAEYREQQVEMARKEAEPRLSHAASLLATVREILHEVLPIQEQARANGASVLYHFDKSSIDYFIPELTYQPGNGVWQLKRRG